MQSLRNILPVIGVIVVGAALVFLSMNQNFFGAGATNDIKKAQQDMKKRETEIEEHLKLLEKVTISTAMFESDEYKSLKDRTVQPGTPVLQRDDPFAPFETR